MNFFSRILNVAIRHKMIAFLIVAAILTGGYYGYRVIFNSGESVRYVTAAAEKGTQIVSISGSGQVSAMQQVDVKSKVAGDVTYVNVKAGQYIPAGALLAQLYARDAQKAVRDAETNLETAQLNYDQITGSIAGIRGDKEKDSESLAKAYDDGFNAVSNAFADLPNIMTGLNTVVINRDFDQGQWNLDYYTDAVRPYYEDISVVRDETYAKYKAARAAYDKNLIDYKTASRFSSMAEIEALINQTYETSRLVSEAIKSASNFVQIYKDKMTEANRQPKALADTHLSSINSFVSKANSSIQSLYSAKNAILSGKESLVSVEFDVRSAKIQLDKAKDSLLDAQEKLAEYYVRAPFGGVVAKMNVKVGDSSVSTVATMITKQKIAEISLNEIDVAKVKTGQKVTLTFDAVSNLTITGQVAEVDAVGTVSQGVVTYIVKIAFDAQPARPAGGDDRIKPGMSVSAAIITEAKPNVLLVPNSAVKSQNRTSYVEIVDGDDKSLALTANVSGTILNNSPRRQQIEIGTASDEFTEITSGLNEGDVIVTRTIQPTAQTAQTQQQSGGLRIPGMR
ncbi:MAG: Efflux transporter, RND family, MFP subunit [Candidatus Azambacteria bacterium GW2011_GWE1_42_9]|nr:MAG: Efflux transporter, RND family, MFP subunit [Candidatus Azambacteria bacterium GW2011_GWF1_41_10]KKS49338.1 MAG: Efflux transporter, RND family, MFP subunit [Candidatus Azambacteria bacterium GW2011_GWF2_42_22]KKS79829.1 MAG: Efflux transporter, RND family, MFP subunit [Candidatus Azambacteria bacterium GW2011_GWE1_42_9]KKT03449.1 MAG: Efflux transporter, RND family, MFP subunit [Candidatus Azambacteria bacterium GW2011_GWD1_43_18]KKT12477.1 MAG: Efflux transporter, RND family, MFP subu